MTLASAWKREIGLENLLYAGVEAISKLGVENVKPADVTSIAGNSRQTFYSYFENIDGMFAEIWMRFGGCWLESLVQEDFKWDYELTFVEYLKRALLDIVVTSHRNLEVQEVVVPKIQGWWQSLALSNEAQQLRELWRMALLLGIQLSAPVTPNIGMAELLLEPASSLPDSKRPPAKHSDAELFQDVPMLPKMLVHSGDFDEDLLKSCIQVIGRAGVANTSLKRIARTADVSTGAIYPRYESLDLLVQNAFALSICEIVKANLAAIEAGGSLGDIYGENVIAGLHTVRDAWRKFRLEMHLAARVDDNLAKSMTAGFSETNRDIISATSNLGLKSETAGAIAYGIQAISMGISLLHQIGLPVANVDHRVMTKHLESFLVKKSHNPTQAHF
jgi:AcrR family transcriptional regulator